MSCEDIKKFFSLVDANASGTITMPEFLALFKRLDKNGSNKLELDEFCAGIMQDLGGSREQAEKAFRALDENNSNAIDIDEMDSFFHKMDTDGSGDISEKEFVDFWMSISGISQ